MKPTLKIQFVCMILAAIGAAGCMPSRKPIVKDTFLISPERPGSPAETASTKSLVIQPFSIAPAYQKIGIVSRTGETRFDSDFYNEYFVAPSRMITNQTRNWLSESGLFAHVLSHYSSVEPVCLLEGHISQLYRDMRQPDQPKAVLEITFFLVQQLQQNDSVRLQKTYSVAKPVDGLTMLDYSAAQSAGLAEILAQLEKDLAQL